MIESNTPAFWRATLALSLGSLMVFSNIYTTQPLLPTLVEHYGISKLEANWSVTITTLTLALSLLCYGMLSDALGRKRLIMFSMAGSVLATFALGFAYEYQHLLILRALQGFCLGGLPAIAIAYMGDEFSRKALVNAVGFYIASNTLGGIGSRLIGGFLGEWLGLQYTFFVMAGWSLIAVLLFAKLLPPSQQFSRHPVNLKRMFSAITNHLSNPALRVAYLIGGLSSMLFINQYSYITFVLAAEPYLLSAFWIGLLFLTYLSGTVASAFSGHLLNYLPQSVGMALGIVIFTSGILLTSVQGLYWIIAGFLLNAFGFFLCHSLNSSWVSRFARHNRASASSLYLVFYYLGGSLGGLYLNPFWEWRGWSGVVISSVCVLGFILLACSYLYRRETS